MNTPDKPKSSKTETAIVAGVIAASLGVVGVGLAAGAENQATSQQDKNAQWNEEAQENQKRIDFENGVQQGSVTIETPAPTVTELPAPNTH